MRNPPGPIEGRVFHFSAKCSTSASGVADALACVVDRADGGEVLVTDTIRQIAVGSDHDFEPLGEFDLKGIPEPMRLHRLRWR